MSCVRRAARLVCFGVLAGLILSAAPLTQLSMHSEPGDWVGGGLDYFFDTSDGSFSFLTLADYTGDGRPDYLLIRYLGYGFPFDDWWYLTFGTNRLGTNLEPGFYGDAQRASFAEPGHPGLDVFGNGRGCNQVAGSFTILGADLLSPQPSFGATFEQFCEGWMPPLSGTIYYNYEPSQIIPEPGTLVALPALLVMLFRRCKPVRTASLHPPAFRV